jgi:four helix bundle protein
MDKFSPLSRVGKNDSRAWNARPAKQPFHEGGEERRLEAQGSRGNVTTMSFSFEQLDVWRESLKFANEVIQAAETINTERKHYRLMEQLESAALSVAQNIAEGKGRFAKKEFIHFLFIARGSLYEVVTILHLMQSRKWIDDAAFQSLRRTASAIAGQINALIHSVRKTLDQVSEVKRPQYAP